MSRAAGPGGCPVICLIRERSKEHKFHFLPHSLCAGVYGVHVVDEQRHTKTAVHARQLTYSQLTALAWGCHRAGLRQGPRRDRLGAKFVESEFEKVDRLMELFVKYEGQVAAAETTFREQLQGARG